MLPRIEMKRKTGGFLGAAKKNDGSPLRAPYRECDRKPENYSLRKDSYFATPSTEEAIARCPKGIKR